MHRALQRKAIESLYVGVCTIIERHSIKDPITKVTNHVEVTVLTDQPCKLSYKNSTTANQTIGPATVGQSTKLFIAPEIEVKPGSKIIVTQRGCTTSYTRSGEPAVFTVHQEIELELFERWA